MTNKTFIGLDIGSNFIKACYASENSDPKPLMFSNQQTQIPAVVISSEGDSVHSIGQDVMERAFDLLPVFNVEENLKNRLQGGDKEARSGLNALVARLHQQMTKVFDILALPEDEFQPLVAGAHDGTGGQEQLLEIIANAGFPGAYEADSYEAVALTFWAENKLEVYKNTPTYILVADFAGQEIRLTFLEWVSAAQKFKPVLKKIISWGLDKIDQGFLDGWLLPRFVENPESLDKNQLIGLRHLASAVKRDLCAKTKQGFKQTSLSIPVSAGNLLKVDRLEITQAEFEGVDLVRNAFQDLKDLLISTYKSETLLAEADHVLLVGGGANCYFVERLAQKIWGEEKVLIVERPELAIARGIAMLGTGQRIQEVDKPQKVVQPSPVPPPPPPATTPPYDRPSFAHNQQAAQDKQRRKKAEDTIKTAATIGVIVSLFASLLVIPGIASFFLIAVEYWLVQKIVKIYGKNLTGGMQWFVFVVLLVMSFALKTVVETLLTIGVVTCIFKPAVAALVIWGIGELTVYAISNDILSRHQ